MHALLFLMALSAPNYDLKSICAPSRDSALAEDRAGAYTQCLREESDARKQVQQIWSQTPAKSRADCNYPGPVTESYVELLICLQLKGGKGFGSPSASAAPK
jgi:hypothetical protein